MNIKAIETEFAGYLFRSRLEARWAVFFNAMGVKWYYEHEGYKLSSGWYLPDFWLPEWRLHVEVKPDGVCEHADAFRDDDIGALLVTNGLPNESMKLYCWDVGDSSAGSSEWDCKFTDLGGLKLCCQRSALRDLYFENPFYGGKDKLGYGDREIERADVFNGDPKLTMRLRDAFSVCKRARFDRK